MAAIPESPNIKAAKPESLKEIFGGLSFSWQWRLVPCPQASTPKTSDPSSPSASKSGGLRAKSSSPRGSGHCYSVCVGSHTHPQRWRYPPQLHLNHLLAISQPRRPFMYSLCPMLWPWKLFTNFLCFISQPRRPSMPALLWSLSMFLLRYDLLIHQLRHGGVLLYWLHLGHLSPQGFRLCLTVHGLAYCLMILCSVVHARLYSMIQATIQALFLRPGCPSLPPGLLPLHHPPELFVCFGWGFCVGSSPLRSRYATSI